eukprot:5516491-Pleurochrysis_carterae.AAC.1
MISEVRVTAGGGTIYGDSWMSSEHQERIKQAKTRGKGGDGICGVRLSALTRETTKNMEGHGER